MKQFLFSHTFRSLLLFCIGGMLAWPVAGEERWITHGPYGGTVTHLLASSGPDGGIYALIRGQGVYFLAEGAETWQFLSNDFHDNYFFDFLQHPQNPDILILTSRDGIYWTTDGGRHWELKTSGFGGMYVQAVAVAASNPQVMFATAWEKIYKSDDGGNHWTQVGAVDPEGGECYALIIDPRDADVAYVGVRSPYSNSPVGIYKTTDGGAHWNPSNTGLIGKHVQTLTFDPENSDTIYAGVYGNQFIEGGGVYASYDAGAQWHRINGQLPTVLEVWDVAVRRDPHTNVRCLLAGCGYDGEVPPPPAGWDAQLYSSDDEGEIWRLSSQGITFPHILSVVVDPQNPDVIYAGTRRGGVFRSTDGGATYKHFSRGLEILKVQALAIHPTNENIVYAAVTSFDGPGSTGQDTGVFMSTDGGIHWMPRSQNITIDGSFDVRAIAVSLTDPQAVFAGHCGWGLFKSTDEGKSWNWRGPQQGVNTHWITSLLVNPKDPYTIYASGYGYPVDPPNVFKSIDGGETWVSLAPWIVSYGINCLALNPNNPDVLYAGSDWQGIYKSVNGGVSWNPAGTELQDTQIKEIVVDPRYPEHVYAAEGYQDPNDAQGIFFSDNGGDSWQTWNEGLQGLRAFSVTIDAIGTIEDGIPATWYAGTEDGAYRREEGGIWEQINEGLSAPYVYTLELGPSLAIDVPRVLYAGTVQGAYRRVLTGDLDYDWDVDLSDLAQLLGHYGSGPAAYYEEGDMDTDGDVDLSDLAALLAVYGDAM